VRNIFSGSHTEYHSRCSSNKLDILRKSMDGKNSQSHNNVMWATTYSHERKPLFVCLFVARTGVQEHNQQTARILDGSSTSARPILCIGSVHPEAWKWGWELQQGSRGLFSAVSPLALPFTSNGLPRQQIAKFSGLCSVTPFSSQTGLFSKSD
jgi:hypothetical protein